MGAHGGLWVGLNGFPAFNETSFREAGQLEIREFVGQSAKWKGWPTEDAGKADD